MREFKITGINDIDFRFKEINPNHQITLATSYFQAQNGTDFDFKQDINNRALKLIEWKKTGDEWFPLINENGSTRLTLMEEKPSMLAKLLGKFIEEIINPVFLD